MLILSIDTSTTVCSVALHRSGNSIDNQLLGCYELFTERTSSAMLTTLINDVVRHSGHQLSQLDAIAVAKGPGSYTGLRIGVSTAKGLCFALDKPLIAVNTLQAMAEQIRPYYQAGAPSRSSSMPYALCPMIDARRMEVYCTLYDATSQEIQATSALVVDEHSFDQWLAQGSVVFFGDGAAKCRALLSQHSNAIFSDQLIVPSARTVGQLAALAFYDGRFEDIATFEPYYLKDFMTTRPKKAIV